MEEYANDGICRIYYGSRCDYVIYGAAWWPSFSYWLIPGTWEE
jgi:hypothetical protein